MCCTKSIVVLKPGWYGMTEAASTVTAKPVDESNTMGFVLPQRRVKVDDGRIYIAGETLASGYYYQGNLTPLVDDTGWFDSKDLGQWVDDQLLIIGRADNQFISVERTFTVKR